MRSGSVFIAFTAAAALAATSADAAPWGIKQSWSSPDAATTMSLTWLTDTNVATTIEYGVASTSENMMTGTNAMEIAGLGWHHEIELSGLQPNTTYRYRVGSAGDFSPESTFRTAPNDQCAPFEFVVLGDARSQDDRGPSRNWSRIQAEGHAAGARFFLNGGDLVNDGKELSQWRQWAMDSEAINKLIPMMPALGNHDDGPTDGDRANYNRLFALPRNTVTGTEDYYHFVYNNLLVFSLSTTSFEEYAAQVRWMQGVAAQHPNKWSLAFFHHPVYTTQTRLIVDVGHPPNEKNQNPHYGPGFDAAGVDIVVQSHNHIYERFRPLRYDPSDPEQGQVVSDYGRGPNQGRLYLVSGGSGAFLDPLIEGRFQNLASGSESRSKDHHFVKIGIAGNTLHYSAVRTTAGNSSGGGMILDSLTLSRPGPDPCATPTDPDMDMDGYPASMDCDDGDPAINPGAAEICGNDVDEDCSGLANPCPMPPADKDMDGSPEDSDCDDNDPDRFPSNPEVPCDGVDQDCSGVDECDTPDAGPSDATPGRPDAPRGAPDARAPGAADAATGSTRADASAPVTPTDSSSCGCRHTPRRGPDRPSLGLLGLGILLVALRRKRRR